MVMHRKLAIKIHITARGIFFLDLLIYGGFILIFGKTNTVM